jgi:2-dehydropantoate 2-reductase
MGETLPIPAATTERTEFLMRVCVYGAGAIGGHLAVRLAKGGAEVSVIARGKHLAAIQANGLEVHDGRKLPRIDPNDVLLQAVGPDRAVGGVVYSASAVIDPGVIEVEQPKSRVVLGEPNGTLSPRVVALAELITKGGISGEATTEIRTEIWNKLIGNLAGGTLAVLSGLAPKNVYTEPAARDAALRVMHEAASIAQALGARPGTNHDGRVASQSAMDHKPSILQDLELGRPMEIDGLFDAPLVLARIAGVATPTTDLLVALCKLRGQASGLYGS